jgi:ligand-binding sensor domain-containing protein
MDSLLDPENPVMMEKTRVAVPALMLFLLSVSFGLPANSSLIFDRLTIRDGLSNNSINDIVQTHDGYVWIATKDGLNRYDGQHFKVFKHNPFDTTTVPENYIYCLLESRDSTLWVGTWGGGLCRYDPGQEGFRRADRPEMDDDYIQCLFQDHAGFLWYGTLEGGFNRLDIRTGRIAAWGRHLDRPAGFPSDNISGITEDRDHRLWISTLDAGIHCFNPADSSFEAFRHNPRDEGSLSIDAVSHLGLDGERIIWISTDRGVNRLDLESRRIERDPGIPPEYRTYLQTPLRQILRDRRGRLWIGTYEYRGLFLLEEKGGITRFHHLAHDEEDPGSLISDRIRWLYEDRRGNLWIGTEDGLNKLPASQPFKQLKYLSSRPNSLGGKIVSSICQGQDSILWIGYNGAGFDRLDLRTDEIDHFKPEPGKRNSLGNEDVVTLYEDRSGILWIGTSRGGLDRYDPATGRFQHFRHRPGDPASLRSDWIQQILETRQGLFLIGTNGGLQLYDRRTRRFHSFTPAGSDSAPKLPADISVNALFEDSQGEIWIGTWLDGLYRYHPASGNLSHYRPQPADTTSLSSSKITWITEDSKGAIWIATHSGGMNRFDKRSGRFTTFTTRNGLPNDVVFGILEDDRGLLWVSTLKGLVRFDPQSKGVRVYDVHDGLSTDQFNWRACCKTASGWFYFGGIDGMICFQPDSVRIEKIPPPVVLRSFRIFNRESALPQGFGKGREITLRHNENFFSFDYAALDIAPQHKHRYAYRLDGIDPDWVQAGTGETASYTDIDPGSYRFHVKACNADGIWSEPVTIPIRILPAWWMTWWFKLCIALALLTAGWFFYRYRVTHLLEIQRMRFDIASDLHDEIGSNLSSISVETQLLLAAPALAKEQREQLRDIGETARETLNAIRDIVWFINPKNDMMEDLVIKLRETAGRLLAGITWSLDLSPAVHFEDHDLEVRRNVFLIYKESLTNIVRHSGATRCQIRLFEKEGGYALFIKDNGRGFNTSQAPKESGLLNMDRRAARIKARLEIVSTEGEGTEIRLYIPHRKK